MLRVGKRAEAEIVLAVFVVLVSINLRVKLGSLLCRCDKFLLGSNHGLNSFVHVLDEGSLSLSKALSVRDVKNAVVGFGVFSMDAADLDVELFGNAFKSFLIFREMRQLDVD